MSVKIYDAAVICDHIYLDKGPQQRIGDRTLVYRLKSPHDGSKDGFWVVIFLMPTEHILRF